MNPARPRALEPIAFHEDRVAAVPAGPLPELREHLARVVQAQIALLLGFQQSDVAVSACRRTRSERPSTDFAGRLGAGVPMRPEV